MIVVYCCPMGGAGSGKEKPEIEIKRKTLGVRLTEDQMEALMELAGGSQRDATELVREMILKALDKKKTSE